MTNGLHSINRRFAICHPTVAICVFLYLPQKGAVFPIHQAAFPLSYIHLLQSVWKCLSKSTPQRDYSCFYKAINLLTDCHALILKYHLRQRDKNLICVVEDYKSAFAFEKVGNFKGVYHILNGLISPMLNKGAEDINLSSLGRRIENLKHPELILALGSSLEAETTILYIKEIFKSKDVTISRLSHGIPMGAEIEYLDMMTLDKALFDRKVISE